MSTHVVNFRTVSNGAFKYMRGLKRGYWRVLRVTDPEGSTRANSRNVLEICYRSPEGLLGVTKRSSYWLGDCESHAIALADELNNSIGQQS